MLAALQAKKEKLAKTETKEFQGVHAAEEISAEDWYAANIEKWYEEIEECTFKTFFVAMTPEEGNVILQANKNYVNKNEPSASEQEALDKMEAKLDAELSKFSSGGFVKLSCRSPKDATALAPEMIARYRAAMIEHKANGDKIDDNLKVIELFTSHIQILRSETAKDALKWFIRSGRVAQDIEMGLEQKDSFPVQFIIREWFDIPAWAEFRGFVYNRQLVALSQYFDCCYFKILNEKKDEVQEQLTSFFENKLRNLVPLDNYIIDFAITSAGQVFVIELNPYNPNTDSCLFSWSRDAELLKQGPLEFRILEKPITNLSSQVLSVWKPLLQEEF